MTWTAVGSILEAGDAAASDAFGTRVATTADAVTMVVGAPGRDSGGTDRGGVYTYSFSGSSWSLVGSVLTASDATNGDGFGTGVALNEDGTLLAVGAPYSDQGGTNRGCVYLYEKSGSAWDELEILVPSDASNSAAYGYSIALNALGTVLAVGAPGRDGSRGGVYIYDNIAGTWVLRGSVLVDVLDPGAGDYFGASVSLNATGDILAVGVTFWDSGSTDAGCVYTYRYASGGWSALGSRLISGTVSTSDYFGIGTGLTAGAETLVVGSRMNGSTVAGAVQVFDWSGSAWVLRETALAAADAIVYDQFGDGVAISADGGMLVVGAPGWEGGASGQGAVYTYRSKFTINTQNDITGCTETAAPSSNTSEGTPDAASSTSAVSLGVDTRFSETAAAASALVSDAVQWFYESVSAIDSTSAKSTTSVALSDAITAQDLVVALFQQLVSDQASGVDAWYLSTAAIIAEVSVATGVASSTATANAALAEIIVALDMVDRGLLEQVGESAATASTAAAQVAAVQQVLNNASATDAPTSYLIALREVAEIVTGTAALTLWQSLTQLVAEGVDVFVRLSISGEAYTGWVLNTRNNAASEYQGLQFNSLARIGNRYFGADDSGIHELAGTQDGTTNIATYLQAGVMDFGVVAQKNVQYAYLALAADGDVYMGVSNPIGSQSEHRWYSIAVEQDSVTSARVPLEKGVRNRYWRFSVASDALETLESVAVLPVVLSRRV
jgi:hypothetical protein